MHRTLTMALLATVTVAGFTSTAMAGSSDSYATPQVQQETSITTFTAAAPPVMETYAAPAPVYAPTTAPAPIVTETVKDGYYDAARYGGNAQFGYEQSHACGGALDGEKCLVILSDHMRRVRLDRPAGTILVGNPLIADVTVLGNDTVFVSARSIGSTNIIVLDKQGNEMVTYEVFVREPRTKRVVLNNGGIAENYQCAPHCERALTQSDSSAPYRERSGVITTDLGLDANAIGLQSGPNPNTDPTAAESVSGSQGGGAAAIGGAAAGGLAGEVAGLTDSVAPALGLAGALGGLLGGGGGGGGNESGGPARTDAPPLPTASGLN